MTNLSHAPLTIGYCTNVHAGVDLPAIRRNLDQYAVKVRDQVALNGIESGAAAADPDAKLGVGLWIPDAASRELLVGSAAADFAAFLENRRLSAFTINGFPYDNFHQDVVKHRVYLPSWFQRERLEYTQRLATILSTILPESEQVGSISTLPIGWPDNPHPDSSSLDAADQLEASGQLLRELAEFLAKIESDSGRRIVVAIEPEPGCVIDTTGDVIRFFDSQLPDSLHRKHITVCHDICHSAVMMEPQDEVLLRLATAKIGIGKVQVSSAVVADWTAMAGDRREEAKQQLAEFAEDRYLHQTGRRTSDGRFALAEDLPQLLNDDSAIDDDRWVVHFHVPIFLERFEHLGTSRGDVLECLRTLIGESSLGSQGIDVNFTGHLEVETYAWTVLPQTMRKNALADDIASEVNWLKQAVQICQVKSDP